MINKPNKWEQSIIDNAVEYSVMMWRPLDKSTKTSSLICSIEKFKINIHTYLTRPFTQLISSREGILGF